MIHPALNTENIYKIGICSNHYRKVYADEIRWREGEKRKQHVCVCEREKERKKEREKGEREERERVCMCDNERDIRLADLNLLGGGVSLPENSKV